MTQNLWASVDRAFDDWLRPKDVVLEQVIANIEQANLPAISVSPALGRFLGLLATISGAQRILEIGTLGGYSTIHLARALPPTGRLITIEIDARHAEVARANIALAGLADRIDLRVGRASDVLPELQPGTDGVFDLVFIDADKPNNPLYFEHALRLSRPGSIIIIDNVVRDGRILDEQSTDASVLGVRELMKVLRNSPEISATTLQTVGVKGYDGFTIALVKSLPFRTADDATPESCPRA